MIFIGYRSLFLEFLLIELFYINFEKSFYQYSHKLDKQIKFNSINKTIILNQNNTFWAPRIIYINCGIWVKNTIY
jgi:hypothetical protein